MRTLKQYADELNKNLNNPGALASLSDELAGHFAFLSHQLIIIKTKIKPQEWIKIKMGRMEKDGDDWKGKPRSDALTEQLWRMSKAGKREVELKYTLDAMAKMMKSINSHIFVLNSESRGVF